MRIGIDGRFLDPEGSGISRYIERLLTHLAQIDHDNDYVVWLRRGINWQPNNPRWNVRVADIRWYTLREQILLPKIFLQAKLDLLHVPHYNIPVLYPGKFVVTVHDLILNEFPTERSTTLEPLLFAIKRAGYRYALNQAIRRSRKIITVSEWSKKRLISSYPVAQNKTRVTYESADQLPPPSSEKILTDHGINAPYLLYAGNAYPHKNLERFLLAVKVLQQKGHRFQTVLVGKRDYFSQRLEKYVRENNIPQVIFYGYASEPDLHRLYKSARAYVFPSMSEGFGLPGLEAMLVGVPVYAARASCLPEIYGTAARYFDPVNVDDIATVLAQALINDQERQQLIKAGTAKVNEYSWPRMAQETLKIYQEAVNR